MSWFSRRQPKPPKPVGLAPPGLESGLHRSPGLSLLSAELEKRPIRAILDLGPSSTGTVKFLSRFCDNISIQDLFHSSAPQSGARSTIFRFDAGAVRALPEERERFDVILLWDLLHYFERSEIGSFVARLAERCREDTLDFLLASAIAPIPLTPIRFQVHDSETLLYQVPSAERVASAPHPRRRADHGGLQPVASLPAAQRSPGVPLPLCRHRLRERGERCGRASGCRGRGILPLLRLR